MVGSALGTWKISQNYLQNWLVVCGFRYVFTSLVQEDADLQPEKLGYKKEETNQEDESRISKLWFVDCPIFQELGVPAG